MEHYTKFTDKTVFQKNLFNAANDFVNFLFTRKYDSDDLLPVGIPDGIGLINYLAKRSKWSDIVRKIFIQNFLTAEMSSQSSGIFSTYFLSKRIIGHKISDIEQLKFSARSCTSSDALESTKKIIDENSFNLFSSLLKETGIFGSLEIEQTHKANPVIEFSGGHKFSIGLHADFGVAKKEIDESKIILVDGAIIEVSQVDFLLNELSETGEPCIIVARSFSPDVLNTLKVNFARKTLKVFPIIVNDSIEHINVFGDLAVCTGSKLISPDGGERINSVRVDELTSIKKVSVCIDYFSFDSKAKLKQNVDKRIKEVRKKIDRAFFDDEMTIEDVNVAYSGRISSLSSNIIRLWIPGSSNQLQYIRKNFKFGIEYFSSFANTGKIKTNLVVSDSNLPNYMPAGIIETSIKISANSYDSIMSAGGCIEIS